MKPHMHALKRHTEPDIIQNLAADVIKGLYPALKGNHSVEFDGTNADVFCTTIPG